MSVSFVPKRYLAVTLLLGIVSGCAHGPGYPEAGAASEPLPDQMARIVFFRSRDSSLYIARKAAVYVGGEKVVQPPTVAFTTRT